MITITKNNFADHFSAMDLLELMSLLKEASKKNNIEELEQDKIYIEIIEITLQEDRKVFVELISVLNEDNSDIRKMVKSIFISENQEDMDELLDKINEYNEIDGENQS